MKTQRVKLVGSVLGTGAARQRRKKRRLSGQQRRYIQPDTDTTEVNLSSDVEVQPQFFGVDIAEMVVQHRADVLGAIVVSLEQMITKQVPYTANRGHISTLIREQAGFTRVTNKNGDFVAISVDSFERLQAEGYQLVKVAQEPEGDNLAMFRGCGEPDKLDLPLPDYQYRQSEISQGRQQAMERILISGNDDAEHTG
jgi:hypothetical protein